MDCKGAVFFARNACEIGRGGNGVQRRRRFLRAPETNGNKPKPFQPPPHPAMVQDTSKLDAVLEKTVAGGVPGIVAIVAKDGKVVYHAARGKSGPRSEQEMTTDHVFQIMSMRYVLHIYIYIGPELGVILALPRLLLTLIVSAFAPPHLEFTRPSPTPNSQFNPPAKPSPQLASSN